ncbi:MULTISPECIES: hypothetical protein [Natrinema]|uniref:Uncharacterized protein n=1 Tax=Natrinema gari JCM 14663 TaxID=1230459 RepID=L9YW65_9EURY|nr:MULTISPECIES: hypothetical protein [Natrinema]AFO59242.1 hypothetical protein NJ7G_4028 [Natrinema sp. J7-2]ELY77727.1 hypothetical protein C486_14889 [Natrinema gari JCM 14663]
MKKSNIAAQERADTDCSSGLDVLSNGLVIAEMNDRSLEVKGIEKENDWSGVGRHGYLTPSRPVWVLIPTAAVRSVIAGDAAEGQFDG